MSTLVRHGPKEERNYLKAIWQRVSENQPRTGSTNVTMQEVRQIVHHLYEQGDLKQDLNMSKQFVNSELTNKPVPRDLYPTAKSFKEMEKTGEPFKKSLPINNKPLVVTPTVVEKGKTGMLERMKEKGTRGYKVNIKGLGPVIGPLAGLTIGTGAALYAGKSWADALGEGVRSAVDPSSPAGLGSTLEGFSSKELHKMHKEIYEHNAIMKANPGLDLGGANVMVHDIFSPSEIKKILQEAEFKLAEEGMANRSGPLTLQ